MKLIDNPADYLCDSGLMTITEVAQFLKVGRTTVYGLLTAGSLPSVRIGRLRRIPQKAVRQFAEQAMQSDEV
jgi:excisionase family DNA binding protein